MTLDCVLRIDKARGPTSHDVVDQVRRLFRRRQVGHAGTLDPLASGLLLVCVGRATKIAPFLADLDKVYRAEVRLGVATDTGDAEGAVIAGEPVPPDLESRLPRVIERFRGALRQVPPMASAVKVGGQPLYRLRRAGRDVERPARTVHVHSIDVLAVGPVGLTLRIACGKGLYVRTLAADLAAALGTCGYLVALRREQIGPFTLADAVESTQLESCDPALVRAQAGMTMRETLMHLPAVELTADAAYAVRHGVVPRFSDLVAVDRPLEPGETARLEGPSGELVAVIVASAALSGPGAGVADHPVPLRFRRVLVTRNDK